MRCVFVISEFLYCQIHNWIKLLPSFFIIIIIISLCKIHIQTHIHTHIHYASSKQRFSCHSGNYRLKTHSKHVCDMTKINSRLYFPDKYLQHDSIIWPVFLNDYKLSGCWLESRCSHLITISRLFRARSSLTFRQLQIVDSLWDAYVTWSNSQSTESFQSTES